MSDQWQIRTERQDTVREIEGWNQEVEEDLLVVYGVEVVSELPIGTVTLRRLEAP